MKHALILARKKLAHNTRVMRQARALVEDSWFVTIISNQEPGKPTEDYPMPNCQHFRIHPTIPASMNRYLRILVGRISKSLRNELGYQRNVDDIVGKSPIDLIIAHDNQPLIEAHQLADQKHARLVYDAVELPHDKNRLVYRKRLRFVETSAILRANVVLTIGPSYKEELDHEYGIDCKVIRNCQDYYEPTGRTLDAVVYSGTITPRFGIDTIVEASAYIPDVHIMLIGPIGQVGYQDKLQKRIAEIGSNVTLHPPVPAPQVIPTIEGALAGLIILPSDSPNSTYAFPNKLFDYIQARVPIVTTPIKDIAELVRSMHIGMVADTEESIPDHHNALRVAAAIRAVTDWPMHHDKEFAFDIDAAAHELCWENEKIKFLEAVCG